MAIECQILVGQQHVGADYPVADGGTMHFLGPPHSKSFEVKTHGMLIRAAALEGSRSVADCCAVLCRVMSFWSQTHGEDAVLQAYGYC